MPPSIAILGWGSLLWDDRPQFDEFNRQIGEWQYDGPFLKIEFSRISSSRCGALTLVLDAEHGEECQVAFAMSTRRLAEDAICDLRCREGAVLGKIGRWFADGTPAVAADSTVRSKIADWAQQKGFDVVVWTDLPPKFKGESGNGPFTVDAATKYLQNLRSADCDQAIDYIHRAPPLVDTPLRRTLRGVEWFERRKLSD